MTTGDTNGRRDMFAPSLAGTIVIEKVTDPPGGAGFGFTDDVAVPHSFTLNHGQTFAFTNVATGTYTITEDDPGPAYALSGLTCDDPGGVGSTTDLGTRQATIHLDTGETVRCIFTNTFTRPGYVSVPETHPARGVSTPRANGVSEQERQRRSDLQRCLRFQVGDCFAFGSQ